MRSNLKLAWVAAQPIPASLHARFIRTEYSGAMGDRGARSVTLEGALRAALILVAHGEYNEAKVFDERFGSKSLALTVRMHPNGIAVTWAKLPKWRYDK